VVSPKKKGVDAVVDTPQDDSVAEAAPAAEKPSVEAPAPAPAPGAIYEHELAGFKEFGPTLTRDVGYDPKSDPRRVERVPADKTVTWATDPRQDRGSSLAFYRGLGFRPVRIEEVTTSPHDDTRLFLPHFEVGPHDYVVSGGGVLMIGYRQYRDERRAVAVKESMQHLDAHHDRLDNAGIAHHRANRSGPLSEVM
jgi:hypothetical protein